MASFSLGSSMGAGLMAGRRGCHWQGSGPSITVIDIWRTAIPPSISSIRAQAALPHRRPLSRSTPATSPRSSQRLKASSPSRPLISNSSSSSSSSTFSARFLTLTTPSLRIRFNSSAPPRHTDNIIDPNTKTATSNNTTTKIAPPSQSPSQTTSLLSRLTAFTALQAPSSGDTTGHSSVRKLVDLARPEKRNLGIAVGLLLVSSSVSMLVPLTIGKLIDFFSSGQPFLFGLSFPVAATLLALTFLIGAACNAGRAIIMKLCGLRIIARIRNQAYLSALRQEPEFADRSAGDIVSRLSVDTSILGESVTSNLSDGLRALISASVGVAAMFWISAKLTLVMLCVVPPVSIGAVFYGRYLRKLSNLTQDAIGEMSKTAEEKLNAFKTVTAYNSQNIETGLFAKRVDHVFQLARKEAYMTGIFWGASGFTGNLAMLCLLGYGGHLVSRGEITVGDLTSLLMYSAYVGGSVSGMTGFFTGLMKGVGAGGRVFWLLDRSSSIPLGVGRTLSPSRNGSIRFNDVRFTYPGRKEVEVLKGVNLFIKQGTSVALVGSSGSGKSSIQALISRFYDPTSGTITFDDVDIREFTPESWRAKIGVVFQDPILFAGTVHDNIAYGYPEATREEVEEAAKAANCDFIWDLPQGFDTLIGKASLSGGQRQRISIARALVRRPTILLLDEATSALDSTSENAVNHAIDRIIHEQNITVILAAHRLSSIARAERVVVLENGQVSEEGRYDVLSKREGSRFRTLMAAQLLVEKSSTESPQQEPSTTEEAEAEQNLLHSQSQLPTQANTSA